MTSQLTTGYWKWKNSYITSHLTEAKIILSLTIYLWNKSVYQKPFTYSASHIPFDFSTNWFITAHLNFTTKHFAVTKIILLQIDYLKHNLFYSSSIDCDLNNLIKGYLTVIQIISSDTIWLAQVNLSETISL